MTATSFRAWQTSTRSGNQGNCVEVAVSDDGLRVGIRDTKNRAGGIVVVPAASWVAFVSGVRTGAFEPQ